MRDKRRWIPVHPDVDEDDQLTASWDARHRLLYLTLRIHRAEHDVARAQADLEKCVSERDRIIQELAAVWDPHDDAEFEDYDFPSDNPDDRYGEHVVRARSAETTARAEFVAAYLRHAGTASFSDVLAALREEFGGGITANHATAVLKRPQFVKVSRGRYGLAGGSPAE